MTKRKSSRAALEIGGSRIEAGSHRSLELRVARLPTGSWVSLPVHAVHGEEDGPTIWLSGAIHGDELDGIEIIRRVLDRIESDALRGTVLATPVVNLFGLMNDSRYLPDRRDLNRSFPGSARGSLAARIAHLFMREIVGRSTFGLDFHCGSDGRENLPQVRGDLDDAETLRLARAFGAPITIHGTPPDGSLRKAARKAGARVLLYEGGEARRFTPRAIRSGVAGTFRVLRALGMLADDDVASDPPSAPLESRATHWLRAGRSGVVRLDVGLGDRVRKGQKIGVISGVLTDGGNPIRSRWDGLVIGTRVNPLVYQGEAIAHVAEVAGG